MAGSNDNFKETQEPRTEGSLFMLLCNEAIGLLEQAVRDYETGDGDSACRNIENAQNFVNELTATAGDDPSYEIVHNLRDSYSIVKKYLAQAKIENNPQTLREVITMLKELNQCWQAFVY